MSEHYLQTLSDSFDHDFGQDNSDNYNFDNHTLPGTYDSSIDFLDYQDPLKHAYKHHFKPLTLDLNNLHFVSPHHVDGYSRSDGTYVKGYFRDGDGNTAVDHTLDLGGGYNRSNPDGSPFNNLK
ncbi:hypothetical protein [Metabacillus sp. FJAT-52054]|uniref:Uncharacterized protein n=1 Tax=Metabacillus sediminis TaxID=3117746 RepID=A0ABZ2NGA0_9BACI